MPYRDIEQIKQAEAEDLASFAQTRSEAEQLISQAWDRSVCLLRERNQAAQAESLAILPDGYTIKINRFLYGRRD